MPRIRTTLSAADRLGALAVRSNVRRMDYKVPPGLYAFGTPGAASPVLVTANYKLTFDALRQRVAGVDAWLLVLDTHGINVWCAAGKGTFGSGELVRRIRLTGIQQLVAHRKLVVPQLGAPGVAAHEVRLATGFHVVWGPIRAEDLPAFLSAGMKATKEMRAVTFTLRERFVLLPVELAGALKFVLPVTAALLVLGMLRNGVALDSLAPNRAATAWTLLAGVVAGSVVTPLLLPWLPGRAFSLKGVLPGALLGSAVAALAGVPLGLSSAGFVLASAAMSSYVAMNFTGSTPFTSLSGVDREMRRWIPLQIAAGAVALGLVVAGALLGRGV